MRCLGGLEREIEQLEGRVSAFKLNYILTVMSKRTFNQFLQQKDQPNN